MKKGNKEGNQATIIVVDNGFVFVGNTYSIENETLVIHDARNIRVWGTSKGLGELRNGPTSSTVLDDCGTIRIPVGRVVFTIDANGW